MASVNIFHKEDELRHDLTHAIVTWSNVLFGVAQ